MPERQTIRLMRPDAGAVPDAGAWITEHLPRIRAAVAEHGAVLLRGLPIGDRAAAVAAVRAVIGTGMPEREGFAPRDRYAPGVYSSSHWPADEPMCMHHELSYVATTPRLLAFACVVPPVSGGVTATADARAVLRDLSPDLVDRFDRLGWRLARRYNPMIGIPWQDAFGVDERAGVDAYCAENDLTAVWHEDGTVSTAQTRPAVLAHPDTGERCWFNQIAFLNEWTLDPGVRDFLTGEFGPGGLPFNTFFGDGTPLDRDAVEHIGEVYERHTVREPWRRGDLLVLDNLRTAHSREPYGGEREIVVGLGEPYRLLPEPGVR